MCATSAIPDMSVASVRAALTNMRRQHSLASETNPIWTHTPLTEDRNMGEFATDFSMGHHLKRHSKSHTKKKVMHDAVHGQPDQAMGGKALQGPKGTPESPFPFNQGWAPKTDAGRAAMAARDAGVLGPPVALERFTSRWDTDTTFFK
jgi:hypothetical protein